MFKILLQEEFIQALYSNIAFKLFKNFKHPALSYADTLWQYHFKHSRKETYFTTGGEHPRFYSHSFVLRLSLKPTAKLHHFLICSLSFSVNTLWLA